MAEGAPLWLPALAILIFVAVVGGGVYWLGMQANRRLYLRLFWEPRDLWIGVYVKAPYWEGGRQTQVVYVCLIPTIVLLIEWARAGI